MHEVEGPTTRECIRWRGERNGSFSLPRCQDSANGMRTAREKESVPSLHSFPCRVLSNRFLMDTAEGMRDEWKDFSLRLFSFHIFSLDEILTWRLVSHSPPVSIFSFSGWKDETKRQERERWLEGRDSHSIQISGMAMSSVLTDFYLRTHDGTVKW